MGASDRLIAGCQNCQNHAAIVIRMSVFILFPTGAAVRDFLYSFEGRGGGQLHGKLTDRSNFLLRKYSEATHYKLTAQKTLIGMFVCCS